MTPVASVYRRTRERGAASAADGYRARPATIILLPLLATVIGSGALLLESKALLLTGWALLTLGALFGILIELRDFRCRLGVGGLAFWGGVLIWLCQDFFVRHGVGEDDFYRFIWGRNGPGLELLTRASLYHFGFITLCAVALRARPGWFARVISTVPRPPRGPVFLLLIVLLFGIGLIPYFLLTLDPWYESLWKAFTSMRSGGGVRWVVRRSGNLNFSWGGYYKQWLVIGSFASLLAGFYALFQARGTATKALCWAMWLFAFMVAFGSGTRGNVVFIGAPILGMAFIRYHLQHRERGGLYSTRAYVVAIALVAAFYVAMQIQGAYRNRGLDDVEISGDIVDSPMGNEMFSSSLVVFTFIPHRAAPLYSEHPIEGWFRAVPQTIVELLIGPIPRALWHSKPIDESWEWINKVVAGTGLEGTTISKGIVGFWYAKFGAGGVFTGALFWGWLFALCDIALWRCRHEPLRILLILAFHAFLFRTFRDIFWHDLYPVLIGIVVYSVVAIVLRVKPR